MGGMWSTIIAYGVGLGIFGYGLGTLMGIGEKARNPRRFMGGVACMVIGGILLISALVLAVASA